MARKVAFGIGAWWGACGAGFDGPWLLSIDASAGRPGAWRWGGRYLQLFAGIGALIGIAGLKRGVWLVAAALIGLGALASGSLLPLAAVLLLTLSAYVLGRLLFPSAAITDCLLVGSALYATLFGLMAHLPINTPGSWGGLLLLPWLWGWRHVLALRLPVAITWSGGRYRYLLHCAVAAALALHFLVALMPEVGHDALAMHLFIPGYLAHHQSWSFDAGRYVWAVMPMQVDWLYAAGYLFAGETGARLVNFGSIVLLTVLLVRVARWAHAQEVPSAWAALIFLVTPLTLTESSSLFIEGFWSAWLVAGMAAALRLLAVAQSKSQEMLLSAVLLGSALAAKAVTLMYWPCLLLLLVVGYRRWCGRATLKTIALAVVILLLIGLAPYMTAWLLTGNPVFPFFNALFKSPLYPAVNFSAAAFFERGFAWNTLYRITFESGRFLEATPGAAGFQWLLLFVPGVLSLALARHRRAWLFVVLAMAGLVLAFQQTAYLRYVLPSFVLAAAVIAVALTVCMQEVPWLKWAAASVAGAVVLLNLLHFNAGTYYGAIDLKVIGSTKARADYLERASPVRTAVELVNGLNRHGSPVAFFASPFAAGLKADAMFVNWYNHRFTTQLQSAQTGEALGRILLQQQVDYVIVDETWAHAQLSSLVVEATTEVARIGPVSVRCLKETLRFASELLSDPRFERADGWHFAPGSHRIQGLGALVSVTSPATAAVEVAPGARYRYLAEARCHEAPAEGRLQVNWMRADGKLARADIKVFNCSPALRSLQMDVVAPADAVRAVVYATAHGQTPVLFSQISFRN